MSVASPRLLLVDGFNVLHAAVLRGRDRAGWRGQAARARLIDALAGAPLPTSAELVVVFDDPRPPREGGPSTATVVHAPDADAWMLERIRSDEHPEEILIATADRPLGDRARHAGARVIGPRALLRGEAAR